MTCNKIGTTSCNIFTAMTPTANDADPERTLVLEGIRFIPHKKNTIGCSIYVMIGNVDNIAPIKMMPVFLDSVISHGWGI